MYAMRTEVMIVPGEGRAFEAWWAQFSDLAKAQRGFQTGRIVTFPQLSAQICLPHALGEPGSATGLGPRPGVQRFLQAHPPQLLGTWAGPQEAYDVLFRVTGEGQPAYAGLVDWTLDPRPGNAARFERSRKEIFELRKQHVSGFVLNGLGRVFDHEYRYQVVQFYSSWTPSGP